ncbi:MAG: DUF2779 domain-containing protein [Limisphaerales bacterium]
MPFTRQVGRSEEALRSRRSLFEATFTFDGCQARADILSPVGKDEWNLVEVKSSTEVKDVNLQDVAFQWHVLTGAGVRLRRCFLLLINSDYVRHEDIMPSELFKECDVTALVKELLPGVAARARELRRVAELKSCLPIPIGRQCDDPFPCPLHDQCWAFLPKQNIFTLYRGGKKSHELFTRGVLDIGGISDGVKLSDSQTVQHRAVTTGQAQVDQRAIANFLKRLKYPLHFLDFETFATAVPLCEGVRPYQQIPFQFSLHVQQDAGAEPEHRMFLADGPADPRPEFLRALREAVGPEGSIVAYNASFEKSRLRECAEAFPEFAAWIGRLERRVVDLWEPFRAFHYYHPDQCGSASMKAVLPALTGKGYENLAIQDGSTASREFLRVTYGQVTAAERRRVRKHLEEYCGLDTEGMVHILRGLEEVTTR